MSQKNAHDNCDQHKILVLEMDTNPGMEMDTLCWHLMCGIGSIFFYFELYVEYQLFILLNENKIIPADYFQITQYVFYLPCFQANAKLIRSKQIIVAQLELRYIANSSDFLITNLSQ